MWILSSELLSFNKLTLFKPKGLLICGTTGPEEMRIAAEVGIELCM
jgi:hypothetical protein